MRVLPDWVLAHIWGGNTSGGQATSNKHEWNDTIAAYMQGTPEHPGGWLSLMDQAGHQPYRNYEQETGKSRIAPFTTDQNTAMDLTRHYVMNSGNDATKAANGYLQSVLGGSQLAGGKDANPYGGMDSPYFKSVLNSGLGDITNAYKQGTSADTTRMFNLSGAFGGSAHQNAVANNESALAKRLGDYTSSMQNDQYNRSAGLQESAYGRQAAAVPYGQAEQGLAKERFGMLAGIGDTQQQMGQRQADLGFQNWADKAGWDQKQIEWVLGQLRGASGGIPGNSYSMTSGGGVNPIQGVLAGLLGYGALTGK
jgi:hypothetical protein